MPMLMRCRGVLSIMQRSVAVAGQSNLTSSLRWLQAGRHHTSSTTVPVNPSGLNLSTSNRFYSTSNQLYSVVATHSTVDAEETTSESAVEGSRATEQNRIALDRIMHSISLNVQRTGRVIAVDFKAAEGLIRALKDCTPNQALLLLRCCGTVCVDERNEDRTKQVLKIWKLFEKIGVPLDESHYNALLRAHIENEHEFSPSEFLSWMESERGVTPNRVTYQLLVSRYCAVGDIAGATTILEFMKEKDMTVNENVFHALITGHCRNGDVASAEGILAIMAESGIDVGAEAQICLLLGMVKAGKSLEEIKARIAAAAESNVVFGDHEIFRLVVEFVRAGNKEAAARISETLPKNRGYFQEMRNAIPQLIHAGEVDLPFTILGNFKPLPLADENHADAGSRDHGLFFLRAMVKNEYPVEKIVEFLDKMNVTADESKLRIYISRLLEVCFEYQKIEYGRKLAEMAQKRFRMDIVPAGQFNGFFRNYCKSIKTKEEAIETIVSLYQMNIPIGTTMVSDLMPKLMDNLEHEEPASVIMKIMERLDVSVRGKTWSFLLNACAQHLLNREDKEGLRIVTRLFANLISQPRASIWNASLARSYLATGELKMLVTIFYGCCSQVRAVILDKEIDFSKDTDLFSTLLHIHTLAPRYRPEQTPDEVVLEILNELKLVNLGIPRATADILMQAMDKSAAPLLDELVNLYTDRHIHLTKQCAETFLKSAKSKLQSQRPDNLWQREENIAAPNFPNDIEGLEFLQKNFENRGQTNYKIVSSLVEAYSKEGQIEKIKTLLENTKENSGRAYQLSTVSFQAVIEGLLRAGKLEDALSILKPSTGLDVSNIVGQESHPEQVFLSTHMLLARALAEAGRHEEAINYIKDMDVKNLIIGRYVHGITDLMDYYADVAKDPVKVQEVFEVLKEKGLIEKSSHMRSLINVHLNMDNLEAAVQKFETFAKESKRMPQKFKLMERLIMIEDVERMQRVLDASISVIGEEKSLYDLAMSFLVLGKTSQARKLLETPGLRYNLEKVDYICNFLIEEKHFTAFENFVHLTQPVFACDRSYLYTKLVNVFKKDSAKMSEIWVRMQEEGFVPSDQLKRMMAAPFISRGEKPPFAVPMENEYFGKEQPREKNSEETVRKSRETLKKSRETRQTSTQTPKEKQMESTQKKEKTAEMLALEQMRAEKLSMYTKSVESNDVATAFYEFDNYLKSKEFVPPVYAYGAIEFFEKNEAWEEGCKIILAMAERDLNSLLQRRRKAVINIIKNSKPELQQEVNAAIKNKETRKQLQLGSAEESSASSTL